MQKQKSSFTILIVMFMFAFFAYRNNDFDTREGIRINSKNFPDKHFRNYLKEQQYGRDRIITIAEIDTITFINVSLLPVTDVKGIEYFTAMTKFYGGLTELTTLDLSKNIALEHLNIIYNKITTLDLSKNTALKYLQASHSYRLKTLDVSKNIMLEELHFSDNKLSVLDVSKNSRLTLLNCSGNNIKKELLPPKPENVDENFWITLPQNIK